MSNEAQGQLATLSPAVGSNEPPQSATPVVTEGDREPASAEGTLQITEIRARLIAESFSGPLPHPDILAKFEQVVPGSAARIIAMAEGQSQHRQGLERKVIEADIRQSWAGLWTGFAIGMTGMLGSILLGIYDQPWLGGVLGTGSLVSLVGVFVYGTKAKHAERADKAEVMTGHSPQEPEVTPPSPPTPPAA